MVNNSSFYKKYEPPYNKAASLIYKEKTKIHNLSTASYILT